MTIYAFFQYTGILFLSGMLLTGCGSGDTIPGGQDLDEDDVLTQGTPLFYIEQDLPIDDGEIEVNSASDPVSFIGNAKLMMLSRASQVATQTNLSERIFSGNYDVRDLDVSHDGNFILFSMRAPQLDNVDDDEQPTWNLWEYDIENNELSRVITDGNTAEKGHDITARYFPNDRDIVFASTRQQKSRAILLDEGKSAYAAQEEDRQQPALNLHVLDRSSGTISQITFNMSHDYYPTFLPNGSIVYSRWDNFQRDNINLYQVNPDGTNNHLLYGQDSHNTGASDSDFQFLRSQVLSTGELYVLARPMDSQEYGGDFIQIDVDNYTDNTTPTAMTNGSGPAQTSLVGTNIDTSDDLSRGGYYSAYFPYQDGTARILVGWSQCRLSIDNLVLPCNDVNVNDSNAEPASVSYGIWVIDPEEDTQVPIIVPQGGRVISDVALAINRDTPTPYVDGDFLTTGKVSTSTLSELIDPQYEEGILHIRSVYDLGGFVDIDLNGTITGANDTPTDYNMVSDPSMTDADDRTARFLKIVKGVPEPNRDTKNPANGTFGRAGAQRAKEIIGYSPIEPDGSVKVRVPANVPLMISITNQYGQRISQRHQNWLSVRPGEVLECKGCHRRGRTEPHGRYDAEADSINYGQSPGMAYTGADPTIIAPFSNATMAEARFNSENEILTLSMDLLYSDVWTDTTVETPDDPWQLRYSDLPNIDELAAANTLPYNANCPSWNGRCRIIINYEEHIQPLWEFERTPALLDEMDPGLGNDPADPYTASQDGGTATCTRCHSRVAEDTSPQIPAAQLELTGEAGNNNTIQIRSYIELFFADVELVDDGEGNVVDCTTEVPRVDGNGDPVLDENDIQIVDTVICPATEPAILSPNGALSSGNFFTVFETGQSHEGYMNDAELRLISEWLDIGGQYFNNHFDAPDN